MMGQDGLLSVEDDHMNEVQTVGQTVNQADADGYLDCSETTGAESPVAALQATAKSRLSMGFSLPTLARRMSKTKGQKYDHELQVDELDHRVEQGSRQQQQSQSFDRVFDSWLERCSRALVLSKLNPHILAALKSGFEQANGLDAVALEDATNSLIGSSSSNATGDETSRSKKFRRRRDSASLPAKDAPFVGNQLCRSVSLGSISHTPSSIQPAADAQIPGRCATPPLSPRPRRHKSKSNASETSPGCTAKSYADEPVDSDPSDGECDSENYTYHRVAPGKKIRSHFGKRSSSADALAYYGPCTDAFFSPTGRRMMLPSHDASEAIIIDSDGSIQRNTDSSGVDTGNANGSSMSSGDSTGDVLPSIPTFYYPMGNTAYQQSREAALAAALDKVRDICEKEPGNVLTKSMFHRAAAALGFPRYCSIAIFRKACHEAEPGHFIPSLDEDHEKVTFERFKRYA